MSPASSRSPAAAATNALRKRDVLDLLGISERTYKTYLDAGLLRPIPAPHGMRHTFSLTVIRREFQLQ
jgi:predicted site-specific integrase-resolvase